MMKSRPEVARLARGAARGSLGCQPPGAFGPVSGSLTVNGFTQSLAGGLSADEIETVLAAQLRHRHARFLLAQDRDDLLFREP
jgi:hypothetical protein